MKRIFSITCLVMIGWFNAAGQVGIAAAPMKLDFTNQSGTSSSYTVSVSNPTSRVLEATITLVDWDRDSLGSIRFYEPGTLPASCSNLIKIFPSTNFLLQPYDKKDFTVKMDLSSVKADSAITSAKNCMLFFTQINSQRGTSGSNGVGVGVNLTVRIGVQLFYNAPNATKKNMEIERFIADTIPSKDSTVQKNVLLTLQNHGDVETDGKVNFELLNLKTGEKTDLPEAKFYTLPNAKRVLKIGIPTKIPKGKYSITALVDYGPEMELKIGEMEFDL